MTWFAKVPREKCKDCGLDLATEVDNDRDCVDGCHHCILLCWKEFGGVCLGAGAKALASRAEVMAENAELRETVARLEARIEHMSVVQKIRKTRLHDRLDAALLEVERLSSETRNLVEKINIMRRLKETLAQRLDLATRRLAVLEAGKPLSERLADVTEQLSKVRGERDNAYKLAYESDRNYLGAFLDVLSLRAENEKLRAENEKLRAGSKKEK